MYTKATTFGQRQTSLTGLAQVDTRPTTRRIAENNRNWSLFTAQLSFLILTEMHDNVSEDVCQFFGAVIHFWYLAFFSWTSEYKFELEAKTFMLTKTVVSHGGLLLLPRAGHRVRD